MLVNGKPYASSKAPLREIGVLLEAKAMHPGRTTVSHLLALARTHGIPRSRVDEVLHLAGLSAVAHQRVGAFSLGMGQRLGIAAALLGDPAVVMLDEPVNGPPLFELTPQNASLEEAFMDLTHNAVEYEAAR